MSSLVRPFININVFSPNGVSGFANGILTLNADTKIPATELDKVSDVEVSVAASAQVVDITLAGVPSLGATFRVAISGISRGANGAQPYNTRFDAPSDGTPLTLAQTATAIAAAINAKNLPGVTAAGVGAVVRLTGPADGAPFTATAQHNDSGITGFVVSLNSAGVRAIGRIDDLLALFPNESASTITANCNRVQLDRTFKHDDGTIEKAKYDVYFLTPADAAAVVAAVDGTAGAAPELQQVEVN